MNQELFKISGSSFLSHAHGRAGARATSFLFQYVLPPFAKFFRAKPKQAGKKEGGLSVIPTRNFCPSALPAESGQGLGKRFRNSAVSRISKQKIFLFLN